MHYKDDEDDIGWKYTLSLQKANIRREFRSNEEPCIAVEPDAFMVKYHKPKSDFIHVKQGPKTVLVNRYGIPPKGPFKILFNNMSDLQDWFNILLIATKTDFELFNNTDADLQGI